MFKYFGFLFDFFVFLFIWQQFVAYGAKQNKTAKMKRLFGTGKWKVGKENKETLIQNI